MIPALAAAFQEVYVMLERFPVRRAAEVGRLRLLHRAVGEERRDDEQGASTIMFLKQSTSDPPGGLWEPPWYT